MNVQLANTYNPAKNYKVAQWYATPKFDGVRAVYIPDKGFFTRNDKPINGLDHMAAILQEFCKCRGLSFIDGELIVKNCSFQIAQSVILAAEHEIKSSIEFHVFAVGGKFKDTSAMLNELPDFPEANIFRIESEIVTNTFEVIETACEKFTSMGYEGIVLRDPDVPYFEGRSNHLLKFKFFKEADLLIVGKNPHDSLVVQGEIDGLKIKSCVRNSLNDHIVGKVLTVKYQSITDKPDHEGFYSLRFPSLIGIKEDRDFPVETVGIRQAKNFTKPTGVIYRNNGIVEAGFQVVFTDKPVKLSYIPDKATMADWKSRLYQCKSVQEGTQLIADLKLTIPKIREFARYLGVRLRGCKYLKAEIVRWVINASLGAKLRACTLMKVLHEKKEVHYAGLFFSFRNKSSVIIRRSECVVERLLEAVGHISRFRWSANFCAG